MRFLGWLLWPWEDRKVSPIEVVLGAGLIGLLIWQIAERFG